MGMSEPASNHSDVGTGGHEVYRYGMSEKRGA
jgi:hypothetical protein